MPKIVLSWRDVRRVQRGNYYVVYITEKPTFEFPLGPGEVWLSYQHPDTAAHVAAHLIANGIPAAVADLTDPSVEAVLPWDTGEAPSR